MVDLKILGLRFDRCCLMFTFGMGLGLWISEAISLNRSQQK